MDVQGVQYKSLESGVQLNHSGPITYTPTPPSFRSGRIIKRYTNHAQIKSRRFPRRGWYGFLADGFTTVIDSQWYYIVLLLSTLYISSWLMFGFMWWGVDSAYEGVSNSTCINNVHDFSSAFLYSLESQLTIGYGFRFISDECKFGIFLLIIQSIVGLMIDSFMLGLMFAKITRPSSRRQTILFSDSAVIYEQNGERYLEFRVADIRRSQLVEAHVRVTLYWYRDVVQSRSPSPAADDPTTDGNRGKVLKIYDLQVGYETGEDRLILLTPVIIRHHITPESPISCLTRDNILFQDIELVVALEAIVESTGLTLQALWSYTEREMMFDYQFKPMVYRQSIKEKSWEVDYGMLSYVVQCNDIDDFGAGNQDQITVVT